MIERRRMLFNFTKFARIAGYANTIELPPSLLVLPPNYSVPLDENMYDYELKLLTRDLWGKLNGTLRDHFVPTIRSLQDYADATGHLEPKPRLVEQNKKDLWNWLNDAEFVRQRLQGLNPEVLTRVNEETWEHKYSINGTTPFNIASVVTQVDEVIKKSGGEDFASALKAGNIFVCDYSIFQLNEVGTLARSFNRYICAPIAVFFRNANDRSLHIIAIQLFPGISDTNPVFYADGSDDWLFAKIWVNSVDGQHLEILTHLFECHMISEIFQVSMNRQLGTNHPVYQLLHPHFYATLFINQLARDGLMALDGPINIAIGAGVPGVPVLISEHMKGWDFTQHSFINSLKNRGFAADGNNSIVSGYFWEEDGLRLWNTLYGFVKKVMELFYKTPEDLLNDFELQQWISEIESPRGGNLRGVSEQNGKIVTIDHLAHVLTNLIWICTAKHSSGNIEQFELYGFVPNVPGALYIPPPTKRGTVDKEVIMTALPPQTQTLGQIAVVYLLSDTGSHPPQLVGGTYPGLDKHPEAKQCITEVKTHLQSISKDITTRNAGLTYPYISLDPSKVANSIYV